MTCETFYLTGVVREHEGVSAALDLSLHVPATVAASDEVAGQVTGLVLTVIVDETLSLTGKCRQA